MIKIKNILQDLKNEIKKYETNDFYSIDKKNEIINQIQGIENNITIIENSKEIDNLSFDEQWYLYTYPDVRHACRTNPWNPPNGYFHYVKNGLKENHLKKEI